MQAYLRTAADMLAFQGTQAAFVACLKTCRNSNKLLAFQGTQVEPMRPAGTHEELSMLQVKQLKLVSCLQQLSSRLSRGSVNVSGGLTGGSCPGNAPC